MRSRSGRDGALTPPGQRLQALDVFRGMTIFLMIVVNTQGSGAVPYRQLMHADWNGLTVTDLVFPSFLFAMGTAMVFAFRKARGKPKVAVLLRIFKRSILIFLVGLALSWYTTMYFTAGGIAFVDLCGGAALWGDHKPGAGDRSAGFGGSAYVSRARRGL